MSVIVRAISDDHRDHQKLQGGRSRIELSNSSSVKFCFCSSSSDKSFQSLKRKNSYSSSARSSKHPAFNGIRPETPRNSRCLSQEQFCPRKHATMCRAHWITFQGSSTHMSRGRNQWLAIRAVYLNEHIGSSSAVN